jgi:ABC-type bacteriocin/lantibiotic exporter with double-glycine peptidase domain
VTARAIAITALVATGCVTYSGGARPFDPSRVGGEPGWIAAAPTPEIRQSGQFDCGAAALAMVAGRWKVQISVGSSIVPAPSKTGIALGNLRSAARHYGLDAYAIKADYAILAHELRAGRPVIVGLLRPYSRNKATSHYEVVIAMRGDEVVTLDPAAGWRVRTRAALDAEWRPAQYPALVVLGPPPVPGA